MTIFDLIDHYQFEYISTYHRDNVNIDCGCCSMVEEMNAIKVRYGKDPIRNVIEKCVCNRHGHQYCIPKVAVDEAVKALMNSMFVRFDMSPTPFIIENKISEVFEDFEELYDYISLVISGISGIGPLTVYDTAKRIGHLFDNPIYPKQNVYLAAGAMEGAKSLLNSKKLHFREPICKFTPFFGSFPSIFIEDMLCIYKNFFQKYPIDPITKVFNIPFSYKKILSVSLKLCSKDKSVKLV